MRYFGQSVARTLVFAASRLVSTLGLLLRFTVAAHGQTLPHLGFMIDASSTVRPVYGVPGSILLGNPISTGALSTACSHRLCLVKTDSAILSSLGSVPAPPGPAVFALDGDAAFVYFRATGALMRWHAGQLDPMEVQFPGEVLSMRATRGSLEVAIRLDAKVSIFTIDDGSLSPKNVLPPAKLVALLDQGILYSGEDGLVLRRPDGTEIRFDLKNASAIFALGDGYVEVQAGRSNYVLRVEPGRESLFLLPESGQ